MEAIKFYAVEKKTVKSKNIYTMKRNIIFIIGFGIAIIGFLACTRNSAQNNAQFSYIEVLGTAEKEVEPDIFYLSFRLEGSSTSKNNINALEKRIIAALQSLDIDTKNDLTITSMSGDTYWWRRKHASQYKRYLVKTGSLDLANKTCDKLDSLKLDYYLSEVDYSNMDELKNEVQQEAVKQARQKAESLLNGENKQIGELIYLQERQVEEPSYYNRRYSKYYDACMEADYSPPAFNKMKISYSIVARFSIQ